MDETPDTTDTIETTQATQPRLIGGGAPPWAQRALAVAAALALVGLLIAIGMQVAATRPGDAPARVIAVTAGPYPLTVSLYKDPADAGYALPFAIAPSRPVAGALSYTVTAAPGGGVHATQVNGSLGRDPRTPNGVTGTVEITVQGSWELRILAEGPAGSGFTIVPITAKPPLVIPGWIAWPIGLLPAIGLALFFLAQRRGSEKPARAHAD